MVVKTRIHMHWMDGTAEVGLLSVPPVLVLWSMNASNSNTSNLWLLHAGCNKDPLYLRAGAMRRSAVQMRMRVNGSEQIGWLAGWHTHHSLEPILPMMLPRVHLYFTTCIHLQKKGASCLSIKIHHHLVYTTNWNLISDIRYSNNQIWCRVIGYSLTRPLKHICEPPWKKNSLCWWVGLFTIWML